jgi:hypothetical protein
MARHNNTLTLEEALQTALTILNDHIYGKYNPYPNELESQTTQQKVHARDILVDYLDQEDFIEDPWYGMDFTIEELEELKALKENKENEDEN